MGSGTPAERFGGAFEGVSWLTRVTSAITRQQQMTGFDCGVACLLYAEKCGQRIMCEDVDATTTQEEITEFRGILQTFLDAFVK